MYQSLKKKRLMKKLLPLCALLTGMCCTLASCSNDTPNDNPPGSGEVPEAIIEEFNSQFPDATDVTWSNAGDGYYTASFTTHDNPQGNNTAWFSGHGHWDMSSYEISFQALPQTVREAFNASDYGQEGSGWRVDDEVDVLERNGNETLYIIEVKKQDNGKETEIDLYFTAGGILVKELSDGDNRIPYEDYLPQQPTGSIQTWLAESPYKDAGIVDIEREDGGTEIELIYNGLKVEILFDRNQQWVYTKTEYKRRDQERVPEAIRNAIQASAAWQDGYNRMEDIELYETAQAGTFYCIELENRRDEEVKIYMDENGKLLEQRPDMGNGSENPGGIPVESDIKTFIETNYPGAVILEKDYDHGLLEVEIRHEGKEKEIRFNGKNEWVNSEWEVRTGELPEAVRQALSDNGYRPDDDEATYMETPDGQWYEIDAYKNHQEWEVRISADGTLISERLDD